MTSLTLSAKLETLPPNLKSEVNDFIDFLIEKSKKSSQNIAKPEFGALKGQINLSKDFDEPLEDFKDYM